MLKDDAAWQDEFLAAIETCIKILRWIALALALYITASIGAAVWVLA